MLLLIEWRVLPGVGSFGDDALEGLLHFDVLCLVDFAFLGLEVLELHLHLSQSSVEDLIFALLFVHVVLVPFRLEAVG